MSDAQQRLPEGLEVMPAGPELAAVLASVDRRALSGKDKVRLLRARHRLAAHVQGELYADMYAISRIEPPHDTDSTPPGDEPEEYPWASAEIAFALRWTHTAASVRLDQARRLAEDLPAVQQALAAGEIDVPKALALLDAVCVLEPEPARWIVDKLIDKASSLTTGQLRAKLRRLVIAADPQAAVKRAKQAVQGRRVEIECRDNHLASIHGMGLAPHRVAVLRLRPAGRPCRTRDHKGASHPPTTERATNQAATHRQRRGTGAGQEPDLHRASMPHAIQPLRARPQCHLGR